MSARSTVVWVNLLCAALFVAGVIAYLVWGSIVRLTADATEGEVAIWIYDSDAARGGRIDARVRIDGGTRARILGVAIDGAGERQRVAGAGQRWGDRITSDALGEGTASLDFSIGIPDEAIPGEVLHLAIAVEAAVARARIDDTFYNDVHVTVFERDVVVRSPLASALRRLGRAGLALGSGAAAIALLVIARRWYLRRNRKPSRAWMLLLLPYGYLGCAVFLPQLSAATRLHGGWLGAVCLATWFAILAIPGRLTLPLGELRCRADGEPGELRAGGAARGGRTVR